MLEGCDVESEIEFELVYNKLKAYFKLNFCTNEHKRKIIANFQTSKIELDMLDRRLIIYKDKKVVSVENFKEISQDYLYEYHLNELYENKLSKSSEINMIEDMAIIFEQIKNQM